MSEILFTGKRIDNGEWVEGYFIHYDDTKDNHKDDCDYIVGMNTGENFPLFDVIPETVGQYTGIKDKNGVKVFEHFIVKWAGQNFAVEWHHTKFVLKKDLGSEMYDYTLSSFDGSELLVIGTTYDNPKLLIER